MLKERVGDESIILDTHFHENRTWRDKKNIFRIIHFIVWLSRGIVADKKYGRFKYCFHVIINVHCPVDTDLHQFNYVKAINYKWLLFWWSMNCYFPIDSLKSICYFGQSCLLLLFIVYFYKSIIFCSRKIHCTFYWGFWFVLREFAICNSNQHSIRIRIDCQRWNPIEIRNEWLQLISCESI